MFKEKKPRVEECEITVVTFSTQQVPQVHSWPQAKQNRVRHLLQETSRSFGLFVTCAV